MGLNTIVSSKTVERSTGTFHKIKRQINIAEYIKSLKFCSISTWRNLPSDGLCCCFLFSSSAKSSFPNRYPLRLIRRVIQGRTNDEARTK